MYRQLSKGADMLARAMALAGGLALLAVTVMTCVSVIGRAFTFAGLGPVPGDFELVEIGVGFAVFAFLPWCQLQHGHARVDLFEPFFSRTLNQVLNLISDLLMLAVSVLIAWRLWLGMLDKKTYTETTFILQFPVWKAYAVALTGATAFALIAAFCVLRSGRTLIRGSA